MPNRLAREKSPYLLQHADNPVDWYPWGPEALERARALDKPILLSVGYSACHWCHVMEHESFENPAIAALMNEHFVSIKVDREERPDIDQVYMAAVQAMTGQGGWPMTVFMTPVGRPYFGGTYFPPEDRYGRPGFPRVLIGAAEAYRDHRDKVEQNADAILGHVNRLILQPGPDALDASTLDGAVENLLAAFDPKRGGFGRAPKFPAAMTLEFLLRVYHRTSNEMVRVALLKSLDEMAAGGIYDHLGGGFHRYSVDEEWLVPHFEKMLYDNALLSRLYLLAGERFESKAYLKVARETLDWVVREMRHPSGGFYSTLDADSEGEEGKFYVWTSTEIIALLGGQADLFSSFYDVRAMGNWDGMTILRHPPGAEVPKVLEPARERLFAERAKRIRPGLDDKIIAAWNGMMLRAFADAVRITGDYRDVAEANAAFILDALWKDGVLLRIWKDGEAAIPGYLEDYACVADGLLALYEATFVDRYASAARAIADQAIASFWDEAERQFYDSATTHEKLIVRPRDTFDNATPSGNSVMADVLLRLHALTGEARYEAIARRALEDCAGLMQRAPVGFGRALCAADFALADVVEVAIVGDRGAAATDALAGAARKGYAPYRVLAFKEPGALAVLPLLEGREPLNGVPAAFVCRKFACQMPVTTPEELAASFA